jgi:hypothetical protein
VGRVHGTSRRREAPATPTLAGGSRASWSLRRSWSTRLGLAAEIRSYYARNADLYHRANGTIPYEDAEASIREELLLAARVRAFDLWLEERRQALAIVEPGYEHPADPSYRFPSHRH